jgi:hypothetical protein
MIRAAVAAPDSLLSTVFSLLVASAACAAEDDCLRGTEGCACLGENETCAEGLYCAAGICVSEDATLASEGDTDSGGTATSSASDTQSTTTATEGNDTSGSGNTNSSSS